ncbi:hypothetical protein AXG93_399s1170 [Marchantia polymorpha subsp. ruderalis]|uniref:Uncharacterized protein n=1 Tax=Marchantia polymorpha subsp. ruderalis TaxID=1480154 RepID=A0A176WI57_MARPO|nr:hypothetical protein AXG93_399s1170 [Marchantia polymorpha subsp. ruderalis]
MVVSEATGFGTTWCFHSEEHTLFIHGAVCPSTRSGGKGGGAGGRRDSGSFRQQSNTAVHVREDISRTKESTLRPVRIFRFGAVPFSPGLPEDFDGDRLSSHHETLQPQLQLQLRNDFHCMIPAARSEASLEFRASTFSEDIQLMDLVRYVSELSEMD